jgi:signal transduction histidine kinase
MQTLKSSTANRRWVFLALLGVLHLVFLQGPAVPFGRLLFLSHIGIGLLWQPFVQSRRRMGFVGTALVVFCATLFSYYLNWGLLVAWTMLLTGVVGGKVFLFPNRWERFFHLLALGYLATMLLAFVLPHSLRHLNQGEPILDQMMLYLMPAVFILMAVLPVERGEAGERAEIVDYIYGVLVFLLLAVIVFGSLSFSLLFKASYYEALMVALALMGGILMLLGFIWDPRAGFGGLGSAVAQHVMSLGLPIEAWLESLAELSRCEQTPDRFLMLACAELPNRLPGVVGSRWETSAGHANCGQQEGYRAEFVYGDLKLELICRTQPSPTMLWHHELAVRLLAEFYFGKWRARELNRLSYVQAIHQTGARLTHDVKNLLQSLETLCVAAEQEGAQPSPRFNELLRRQLPELAARLRQTLLKLAAPGAPPAAQVLPALTWLESLRNRYAVDWIEFKTDGDLSDSAVADTALFSSIAENLLQNIADKRQAHPGIRAIVRLHVDRGRVWLEVSDNGAAIPAGLSENLLREHVPSENGLGIGLFQSARLAEQGGYRLELVENRAGCVRFRLAPGAA